jgi:hypothetical protein
MDHATKKELHEQFPMLNQQERDFIDQYAREMACDLTPFIIPKDDNRAFKRMWLMVAKLYLIGKAEEK